MKNNKLLPVSLKVMMMSLFASLISFMLTCLLVVVSSNLFFGSDAPGVRIFMQFVGLCVQLIFTYGVIWECGNADAHKVRLGEGIYSEYRGFLIGLIASIPFFVMSISMCLMTFDILPDITGLMRVCSAQFWGIYTFLLPVSATHIEQGESGHIAQSVATPVQAICAAFVPVIIPLLAQFPYKMGRIGFSFGEKILLKDKKK